MNVMPTDVNIVEGSASQDALQQPIAVTYNIVESASAERIARTELDLVGKIK